MPLARRIFKTWRKNDLYDACRLYLVTSKDWVGRRSLAACVAEAIVGGVSMVQLRQKGVRKFDLAKQARELAPVCRIANVPLVVNDNLEVAKFAGVDGVHLGQSDISCVQAREQLGPDAVVGVTVATLDEALAAESDGATYLCVGPFHTMANQPERPLIGYDVLREISSRISLPVVAFGGLNSSNVSELADTGANGAAFMSAILAAKDIASAASILDEETRKYCC